MSFLLDNLFSFLTFIGFIILYFVIKNLLPSYFKAKGKNLATKEDVTEITKLVEEVKHSFTVETEKIKTKLNVIGNAQISIESELRNSLLDTFTKYHVWLNRLCSVDSDQLEKGDFQRQRKKIDLAEDEFKVSQAKLKVFTNEQKVIDKLFELHLITLEQLGNHAGECLIELDKIEHFKEINAGKPYTQEKLDELKKLATEQVNAIQKFHDKKLEGLKKVFPVEREFRKLCQEQIFKILGQE